MVELIINKQRAVLPDTASIKLTRTNPMLGTSGDYTLDVTLDLAHCTETRAIFGLLHRPDADLRKLDGKRFPALLTAGHTQMAGAVRVTNTTNESVKVQFLAGKTMLGRGADLNETYINRIDSISVPYPVEKKLTKWEQAKVDYGGYALVAVIILLTLAIWLARRYCSNR